jgi:hypothetical protein
MDDAIIFVIGSGLIVLILALCAWWTEKEQGDD